MKIYFDNVDFAKDYTGPNCFASRLAKQLSYRGHTVADHDDYDVALAFIEPTERLDRSKPFVLRLDGLWFKPEQFAAGMNDRMMEAYNSASAVVFQSEFDKTMTVRWFGDRQNLRPSYVVRNGVEIAPATVRSEALLELRHRYDKVFVCSSQWHPQKRLRDNVEVFKELRKRYRSACLIVLGGNAEQVADKDIFYAGNVSHELCAEVYAMSDWMLHLAYLDHCPNCVNEAIAQGCPVICSSEGGTKEIVGTANGLIVPDAVPYDFSLLDYDDPPRVALGALQSLPEGFRADPRTVDIVHVAERYERILSEAT